MTTIVITGLVAFGILLCIIALICVGIEKLFSEENAKLMIKAIEVVLMIGFYAAVGIAGIALLVWVCEVVLPIVFGVMIVILLLLPFFGLAYLILKIYHQHERKPSVESELERKKLPKD